MASSGKWVFCVLSLQDVVFSLENVKTVGADPSGGDTNDASKRPTNLSLEVDLLKDDSSQEDLKVYANGSAHA